MNYNIKNIDNIKQHLEYDKSMSFKQLFCVIGKEEFLHFYPTINKSFVVISVAEPLNDRYPDSSVPEEILNQFKAWIKPRFYDIDDSNYEGTISLETSKEISSFIKEHKSDTFVIHCEAGMSRSAAIAKALLLFLYDNSEPLDKHWRYYPNKLVFKNVSSFLV